MIDAFTSLVLAALASGVFSQPSSDRHFARARHERDLVGRGREVRAAVERVDALGVPEADAAKHLLDAFGLRADLADDVLRLLRKERRVDGAFGPQPLDELFVLLREDVRLGVRQPREVPPEGIPQV